MAYAEEVKSPRGDYWRGRYKDPDGRYLSVRDEAGRPARFAGKREALRAANAAEADVGAGRWRDPAAGEITFRKWASEWYAGLELAETTMENRKLVLETHLIPEFGKKTLREMERAALPGIRNWERKLKAAGYAPLTVRAYRNILHTCLEDAVPKHMQYNPATVKPNRGRRSGRTATARRGSEKAVTDTAGILATAERFAILTGRDDEFVMIVLKYFGALRLGELIGLEREYVRRDTLRVEWQLARAGGRLVRCAPKDDSIDDVVMPPFIGQLLAGHMKRVPAQPCPCHGKAYVFRGAGIPKPRWNRPLRDLALLAGIDYSVVRKAVAGGSQLRPERRREVLAAAERFGFERESVPDGPAWHCSPERFQKLFTAAASGWYPPDSGQPRRPVLLKGDWPGTRVKGPQAARRGEFMWLPAAPAGLTPHCERHSIKTTLEWRRIPEIASETHMRHRVGGVSGVYRHTTPAMRAELADVMTDEWTSALDARLDMSLSLGLTEVLSPVTVLDGLLRERLEARKPALVPRDSPGQPENVRNLPGGTRPDLLTVRKLE